MFIKDGKAIVSTEELNDLRARKQIYKSDKKDGVLYRGHWSQIVVNDESFQEVSEEEYLQFLDELRGYSPFYFTESAGGNQMDAKISGGCKQGVIAAYIEYKPVKKWFIDKNLLS